MRGIVVDNNDPKKLGRLKVRIQSAYGDQPVDNLLFWLGVWQAEKEKPVRTEAEIQDNTADAYYYKEFRTTSGHTMIFCAKPGEEYV